MAISKDEEEEAREALMRFVRWLARAQAREDHEKAMKEAQREDGEFTQ